MNDQNLEESHECCNHNHHAVKPPADEQTNISSEETTTVSNEATSENGEEQKIQFIGDKFGCEHYRRRCQKKCPDCNEFFACRVCHDDVKYHNEFDYKKAHKLDRKNVKEIRCNECLHVQKPQQNCEKCGIEFAGYFCGTCNLFDNEYKEKEIFHCEGCGICRVGGRDKSFHCEKCDCCIDIAYKHNHKCVSLKQDCPVCMQDMHDTRLDVTVPKCGHGMHLECLRQYIKSNIACPICKKSLVDPKLFEEHIDMQIAETPMPDEYKDVKMLVLCNDCLTKSCVPFHVLGGKCSECSSYNTSRVDASQNDVKMFLEQLQENKQNDLQQQ